MMNECSVYKLTISSLNPISIRENVPHLVKMLEERDAHFRYYNSMSGKFGNWWRE